MPAEKVTIEVDRHETTKAYEPLQYRIERALDGDPQPATWIDYGTPLGNSSGNVDHLLMDVLNAEGEQVTTVQNRVLLQLVFQAKEQAKTAQREVAELYRQLHTVRRATREALGILVEEVEALRR